jgi:hypothetical protein
MGILLLVFWCVDGYERLAVGPAGAGGGRLSNREAQRAEREGPVTRARTPRRIESGAGGAAVSERRQEPPSNPVGSFDDSPSRDTRSSAVDASPKTSADVEAPAPAAPRHASRANACAWTSLRYPSPDAKRTGPARNTAAMTRVGSGDRRLRLGMFFLASTPDTPPVPAWRRAVKPAYEE